MAHIVADESWIREIYDGNTDGTVCNLTFCGVLEQLYRAISFNWKSASTRKLNAAAYNNIILPALANHDSKRIGDYTYEDYEDAIRTIRNRGYEKGGVHYQYSESTIKGFENLIYLVVFQASVYGLCANVLWGTRYVIDVPTVENKIEEKVRLKKSLEIDQEKKLTKRLLESEELQGAEVGVLLMLALGLRNGEACGINYGDIKSLDYYTEDKVVWIYKSVIPKSSKLQSSGKTWNTGRITPVPEKVYALLEERKQRIAEHLRENGLEEEICVDELPVVCKGYYSVDGNYKKRATAQDITDTAKTLFAEIGMEPRQLAYLENELAQNNLAQIVNEKDATAYLLRRNYATHLSILGLSVAEIQYLIGHDVEDAYEVRNEFVDEDRLHLMAVKLRKRPLLNHIEDRNETLNVCIEPGDEVRITIKGKEPMDGIKVKVSEKDSGTDNNVAVRYYSDSCKHDYGRAVDITKEYHRLYGGKRKKR